MSHYSIKVYIYFPLGDKNALQNIILYHLTPGVFIGKGFEPGVTNILKTTQGSKIFLKEVSCLEGIYDSVHPSLTKYSSLIKFPH